MTRTTPGSSATCRGWSSRWTSSSTLGLTGSEPVASSPPDRAPAPLPSWKGARASILRRLLEAEGVQLVVGRVTEVAVARAPVDGPVGDRRAGKARPAAGEPPQLLSGGGVERIHVAQGVQRAPEDDPVRRRRRTGCAATLGRTRLPDDVTIRRIERGPDAGCGTQVGLEVAVGVRRVDALAINGRPPLESTGGAA